MFLSKYLLKMIKIKVKCTLLISVYVLNLHINTFWKQMYFYLLTIFIHQKLWYLILAQGGVWKTNELLTLSTFVCLNFLYFFEILNNDEDN